MEMADGIAIAMILLSAVYILAVVVAFLEKDK